MSERNFEFDISVAGRVGIIGEKTAEKKALHHEKFYCISSTSLRNN